MRSLVSPILNDLYEIGHFRIILHLQRIRQVAATFETKAPRIRLQLHRGEVLRNALCLCLLLNDRVINVLKQGLTCLKRGRVARWKNID